MNKKKAYVRGNIYPELYIHLKLKEEISAKDKSKLLAELAQVVDFRFWEAIKGKPWFSSLDSPFIESVGTDKVRRPIPRIEGINSEYKVTDFAENLFVEGAKAQSKIIDDNYGLIVELEDGSLKFRTSTAGWAFVAILQAINSYGDIRTNAEIIYDDVKAAYEYVTPYIYEAIGVEHIDEIIRKERRKDVVTKLGKLIVDYEGGRVDRDYYLQKSLAILTKINQATDSHELMPAVTHYLTDRFGDIPEYHNILRQLPQPPEDIPPQHRNFPNPPPAINNLGGLPMPREEDGE